jgi:hypothetical protein
MNNKNYLNSLQTINGTRFDDFSAHRLAERDARKEIESKVQNEQKEIIRRLRIQNKKLSERSVILKEKLKQTSAEKTKVIEKLANEKRLNISLSGALGSCSDCWGEDPACKNCSGRGIPGWRRINSRLFNIYVLPVLAKIYGINLNK